MLDISPDLLAQVCARWPIARLATLSAHGTPHVVPVVFCAHDGCIYSPIDGKRKTTTKLRRLANINANPAVSLLIDSYTDDWEQLWWLRIDGNADYYAPAPAAANAIADRLLGKYPQYCDPDLRFDPTTYLRVQPASVAGWAQTDSVATIERSLP